MVMTGQEFARKAKIENLYDKAQKTLCATSDGSVYIDAELSDIQAQAAKEGLEFFVLKGTIDAPAKKDKAPLTE